MKPGKFCKSLNVRACRELQRVESAIYTIRCKKFDKILNASEYLIFKCQECEECPIPEKPVSKSKYPPKRAEDGTLISIIEIHKFDEEHDISNKNARWTKEEEKFIKDNYFKMTIKELAIMFKRTYKSIDDKILLMGIAKV